MNMAIMVNLSGGSGDRLRESIASLEGRYPNRFVTFANVDFSKIDEEDFGETAAKIQDRVLFGKDSWAPDEYPTYFRTLETADEYFDYYRRRHANWKIYGLDLPDAVLRKIYFENAMRIIPGLEPSLFPERGQPAR